MRSKKSSDYTFVYQHTDEGIRSIPYRLTSLIFLTADQHSKLVSEAKAQNTTIEKILNGCSPSDYRIEEVYALDEDRAIEYPESDSDYERIV